jgi:hypothetical protein
MTIAIVNKTEATPLKRPPFLECANIPAFPIVANAH